MQTEVSLGEKQERLDILQAKLTDLTDVKLKIRKLNHVLADLAIVDRRKQLSLILSALKYVGRIETPPNGVKPLLVMVTNELQSLREGIQANIVRPNDLVLTASVQAVTKINEIIASVRNNIQKLEAAIGDFTTDTNEALIRKNQAAKEKIPAFNGKDFVIGRAPVAFTFVNKQKHSSVGYVDKDLLDKMGFKSDNLGGYTLLHNQMVVGIDAHAVYNKLTDDSGKESMVRQRVKDSVITFKAGKPTRVVKARDKLHLDVAKKVKKLIEQKTNTRYEFVSEVAVGLNNGEFFWLMPVADLNRLARAFPGGHAKINKWGFAF
jgi:hypothetical protein